MARPIKKGLDYFPFDVTFFSDTKIRRLRTKYGNDGIAVYIYFLCTIYADHGYYTILDEDYLLDVSDALNISENLTRQIVDYLCSRSLLHEIHDSTLAAQVKVITASSVQRRYQEAKKGCKKTLFVKRAYWLLEPSETASFIKVGDVEGFSENNEGFSENNGSKSGIYTQTQTQTQTQTKTQSKSNQIKSKEPVETGDDDLIDDDEQNVISLFERKISRIVDPNDLKRVKQLIAVYGCQAVNAFIEAVAARIAQGAKISSPLAYLEKCLAANAEKLKGASRYTTDYDASEIEAMMLYDWTQDD